MDTFESLMAEVMAAADRFGHRVLAGHYSSARLASALINAGRGAARSAGG